MSADLLYSIGLDVSDLKTAATAAKEQTDEIKKSFRGFKDVLEVGGVAAAVFGFFRGIIDYAEQANAPLESNVAAVGRLGRTITGLKNEAMDMAASVVGFFVKAGEGWGLLGRTMIEGTQNAWDAAKRLDFRGILDGYKKGFEDVRAAHLAEIEVQKQEAALAEEKKKSGDELKRLGEQIAAIEKQRNALALEGITKQETVNNLVNALRTAREAEVEAAGNAVAHQRAKLLVQETELSLVKALRDVAREDLESAKKADAQAAKELEDRIKAYNALGDVKQKELEFDRQRLGLEEQQKILTGEIVALEKELADGNISDQKQAEVRLELLEKRKAVEQVITKTVATRAEKEREVQTIIDSAPLDKLVEKRTELAAQAGEQYKNEGKVDQALQDQIDKIDQAIAKKKDFYAIGRINGSSKDQDLTDRQLETKIANLRSQQAELEAAAYGENDYYARGFLNIINPQLTNAQMEQQLRRSFRMDYATSGEAALLKRDPFQEERYRNYIRPEDEKRAADQAKNIAEIQTILRRLLPAA